MEPYDDNTPTGCCHVYSYGEDTPRLLVSRVDFIKAIQITAYCSTRFNVTILAFVWMNSHFHFVLKGSADDCQAFGEKVMQLLLLFVNRTRGSKMYIPSAVLVSTKEIIGLCYLKTLICYVLRNPIDAGFKLDPREYEWSSARLYFTGKHERGCTVESINYRKKRNNLGNYDYPATWTVSEEGVPDYENFVNYRIVEEIFGGIRGLLIFMAIKKTEVAKLNIQCEKSVVLSDSELSNAAIEMSAQKHWPHPSKMNMEKKILLGQVLRGKYGCGKKQLARVLGLPYDLAERVLN